MTDSILHFYFEPRITASTILFRAYIQNTLLIKGIAMVKH